MKCNYCGKEIRADAKFCPFCGQLTDTKTTPNLSSTMMLSPKIFITHSWRDIELARRLYADLKSKGFEVWFDDRSVQAGHRLAEEINRGLAWCDVYIPILSGPSLTSPWCQEEINAALTLSNEPGREKRPRIIPVLVENCQDQMPPMLKGRLYVNFTGRYEEALQELIVKGFELPATTWEPSGVASSQTHPNVQPPVPMNIIHSAESVSMGWITRIGIIAVLLFLLLTCGVTLYALYLFAPTQTPTPTLIAQISTAIPMPTALPPTPIPTTLLPATVINTSILTKPPPPTLTNPPPTLTKPPTPTPTYTPRPPTLTPTYTPRPTNTPTPQRQGFFIVNRKSDKCIDVWGKPGTWNEAILQLWDCEYDNPITDQRWEWYGDGFLRNTLSNKCIDAKGKPGILNETPLQLWDCEYDDPTTDQRWEWYSDGFLRNKKYGKCFDAKGRPGTANETPLQLWDCETFPDPTNDQRWRTQ